MRINTYSTKIVDPSTFGGYKKLYFKKLEEFLGIQINSDEIENQKKINSNSKMIDNKKYYSIREFKESKIYKFLVYFNSIMKKNDLYNKKIRNLKIFQTTKDKIQNLRKANHVSNFHITDSQSKIIKNYFREDNKILEKIRIKYICAKQVKKGIAGTKLLLKYFKNGTSIALMIDQRVSQGIKSNFFGQKAFTTSIPAQFAKKFKCDVVPIYIERINNANFKIIIKKPIKFSNSYSIEKITNELNIVLQEMIIKNPGQWIWTHNRWKI